jgi:hypothetical protein
MTLKEALINQGNTPDDADEIISSMNEDIDNGADPEEVLEEYGLEPDYVMDLIG